ncbi:MAG: sugar kinase [Phycisphaerales bacterium]|nr:MAG: sugar kinase [Phycisphaerales bacterium]
MSLLVTGTVGIDTVITPQGRADDVLGGSAVYFTLAAAAFTPVRLVAVVGDDFPDTFRSALTSDRIDLAGLERRAGSKTFRWTGKYLENMNERQTLRTDLNVIAEAPPVIPDPFKDSTVVFLANTHPALQLGMRRQVPDARLVVCDTMDLWINAERDALRETLAAVDGVVINDSEAVLLTGQSDVITAGRGVLKMGPKFAVIKKGAHGAVLVTADGVTAIPAFPSEAVKDPTGAGDSFAGGMLGYLAACESFDYAALRRALVRATVVASFTIEDFSVRRLQALTRDELDGRVAEFTKMLTID